VVVDAERRPIPPEPAPEGAPRGRVAQLVARFDEPDPLPYTLLLALVVAGAAFALAAVPQAMAARARLGLLAAERTTVAAVGLAALMLAVILFWGGT
jgi:hypothetical protein